MNERTKILRGLTRELEGYLDPSMSEQRQADMLDDAAGAVMAELGFEED